MDQQNNGKKMCALSEAIFPSTVPLVLRIMSVIAAVVLLTAGALFATGYFSEESEPAGTLASPSPAVDREEQESAEVDVFPQTDIPAGSPETDPAGLTLRGGSGAIYNPGDSIILYVGEAASLELLADGEPADAGAITWKSFDEAVVSIDSGTLTALSAGEAQCRATYSLNNRSISVSIIVKEAEAITETVPPAAASTPKPYDTPTSSAAPTETPAQETPGKLTPVNPFSPPPASSSPSPVPDDNIGESP